MRQKKKELLLFIPFTLIFTTLFYLFIHGSLSSNIISNYRLNFSSNEVESVIKNLETGNFKDHVSTADDSGFLFAFALSSYMEGQSKVKVTSNPEEFPFTLKFAYFLIHLGAVFLLVFSSEKIVPYIAKIILLIFLLSPNFLSVFWGTDVYIFPIYAIIVTLYALGELREEKLLSWKMCVCSLAVAICDIFRRKSVLLFLPITIAIAFSKKLALKEKISKFAILVVSVICINGLVGIVFDKHGHEIWHSLHAGLFEYGGCVGTKGESYPYFIFDKEELADKSLAFCHDRWADGIQYKVAELNGAKELFSKEYNDILKNQIIEIITHYPQDVLSLVVMRVFNALSFLPIKSYTSAGALIGFNFFNLMESLLFIAIFLLWLRKEKDIEKKWIYSTILIFTLPGPLLVHSKHIIYNLPVHFMEILIISEFIKMCIPSRFKQIVS